MKINFQIEPEIMMPEKNENIEGSQENLSIKILEQIPIGILSFSYDWTVEYVNENFLKFGVLYYYDFSSLLGSNILQNELFPGINLKEDLISLQEGHSFEKEIKTIYSNDKRKISLVIKAVPVFENEQFNGGILLIEDLQFSSEDKRDKDTTEKLIGKLVDNCLIIDSAGKILHSYGKIIKQAEGINYSNIFELIDEENEDLKRGLQLAAENKISSKLIINTENLFYEVKIAPLIIKNSLVELLIVSFADITDNYRERKKLENELSELKFYQALTETSTDAVVAVDNQCNIIFWNKSSEMIFGYTRSEVFGKPFNKILPSFVITDFKDRLDKGETIKERFRFFSPDHNEKVVEAKFSSFGESGSYYVAFCNDVTEKVKKENILLDSQKLLSGIVSGTNEMIAVISPDGDFIFANYTFLNTLSYFESEIINKNITDFIDKNFDIPSFDPESILQKNKKVNLFVVSSLGKTLELETTFSSVYDDEKLKYIICYFKDLTEKKNADQNLMVFRSFFTTSKDGIAVIQNNKIFLANNSFARSFGYYSGEDLSGTDLEEILSDSDIKRIEENLALKSNFEKAGFIELELRKRDGNNLFIELSATRFNINNRFYTVISTRDITERKNEIKLLKESEEKYRNVTESIDDFIYTYERVDSFLKPVFFTSSVEKITGYPTQEFLNDSRLILKIIHPDDLNFAKNKLITLLRSRYQLSGDFEFRIINRQGNIVWVRNKINLARKASGEVQKIYGLVSDISLKVKAEEDLKKSTEGLIKLNETKDRFISIVSHDLRTPFSSILGFTDLLLNDDELTEEERKQYVHFIRESSSSMLKLVNSLLDWTRLQTGRINFEPEKISIKPVIDSSINALSGAAIQKNINLYSYVDDQISVYADKDLLSQVFNNLISNAIKFTKEGGQITVSVSPLINSRFYEFSVKDTGIGIKPENIEKLFHIDSKYTSSGTAGEKGSGLGLSLVKEIIEKHGGKISVKSEYGKGSEFIFSLPVASPNILLVEDNNTDRLLYSKILKNITPDYNIETASDGEEALRIILASPPALVITDHLMPKMNGYQLVEEINKSALRQKPPVIVLSNAIDRNTIHDYNLIGIDHVFHKPVNLSDFKQAVEKSLKKVH